MGRIDNVRFIIGFAILAQFLDLRVFAQSDGVWIGIRADGRSGRGTFHDPFDGGTQEKLDALMPTIPPRAQIHFGAGTFITKGIQAKEGWSISGLGKNRTTIQLADNTVTDLQKDSHSVIWKFWDGIWLKHFELRDLTLDCNRQQQPAFQKNLSGFSLNAYLIAAKNATITNVRALGTWANPGEGFPCMILHDGTSGGGDRIEISGVENLNPIGYLTAISVADQNGGAVTGFIRDCLVTDNSKGSCFGAGASHNFRIYRNRAHNSNIGVNFDTYPAHNLEIFGNQLYNTTGWGILFNNSSALKNIRIHDNRIEMMRAAGPALVPGQARATVQIYGNTIIQHSPASGIISGGENLTGEFHDNVIQNPTGLDLRTAPRLVVSGNRDPKGKLLKPRPDAK